MVRRLRHLEQTSNRRQKLRVLNFRL
jgi:hypothetical protein